jgi:hypothetical protein
MTTEDDFQAAGFTLTHSAPHCRFFSRNYLIEGIWCHATASRVLWKGEWNWQVEIWGTVHEPKAPQGAVRQVRLYNPTARELETALELMGVPRVRVSSDKYGTRVIAPETT